MSSTAPTIWPRLRADAVVTALKCIFTDSQQDSPSSFQGPGELYEALVDSIRNDQEKVGLRFFLVPLHAVGAADQFPHFDMVIPQPADIMKDTCIRRVMAEVRDNKLLICVEGVATKGRHQEFIRSLLDVLTQAACLIQRTPGQARSIKQLLGREQLPDLE